MKGIQEQLIESNTIAFLLFPKISTALHALQEDIYTFQTIHISIHQRMVGDEVNTENFIQECLQQFTNHINGCIRAHTEKIQLLLREESAIYQ